MAPNGAKFKDIGVSMITGLIELYKTSYEKLEENFLYTLLVLVDLAFCLIYLLHIVLLALLACCSMVH